MNRTTRLAAVYIALAAMFLRALIPLGWMPDVSHASGAPFVICTTQGPMLLDSHGQQPQQHNGTHHTEACPFAAAPSLSAPTTIADLAPPSSFIARTEVQPLAATANPSAHYTPQSLRGPPNLA